MSRTIAFRCAPTRGGDEVGFVAFQNEEHYYFLSLAREAGWTDVRLEKPARKRSNP